MPDHVTAVCEPAPRGLGPYRVERQAHRPHKRLARAAGLGPLEEALTFEKVASMGGRPESKGAKTATRGAAVVEDS